MTNSENKKFMHVDMDAFFASVEERDRPDLKGKPVVIGAGIRGVVSSANYLARKYGIHSAMPVSQARRLAPNAIFISPNHEKYSEVSDRVMEIFDSISPLVEQISVDEAFIDISGAGKLLGTAQEIGQLIRKKVFEQEKITCSVGIAPNKFIAKLASTSCKPNGLREISLDGILDFLHPLPVGAMWGVGEKTEQELHSLGLRTIGDIAHLSEKTLIRALGNAAGKHLYQLSWGKDDRAIEYGEVEKSISAAETFAYDLDQEELILREFLKLTARCAHRMRAKNYAANTVSIKVRFADFRTISKAKSSDLPLSTNAQIYEVVKKLYQSLNLDRARIRLVSVSLEKLVDSDNLPQQLTLGQREKGWNEATAAMDLVEDKFGGGSIRPASLLKKGPRKDREL